MELETVEKEGRLIVDMQQNHTLANLIRKAVWENEGEAGYDKGHPLGDESNLIIKDDNPEQVLEDAIETVREWMDDLEDQV
ncbi:RpoL/Rpb11 RNA polymerase subunit family protein [Candidatus Nanohalobium constans]|uniref:DNA-directed RNA polymerase subunit Rpo11 n=1 Tax=Candidatus Nanohalobium constans TaxID=2565781 RepID=A0A5Q0UF76_9ARCH|nr:RpoL/Rpb11 RNA polymerase subunit family protein [Candidatus Nanohalobium constans]QGA80206.1 DNA-directed RNA polymerase subunit L [Candidatus Nanohalobium constans]